MPLGYYLRNVRVGHSYAQRWVAEQTGIEPKRLNEIEHDRIFPTIRELELLAKVYRMSPLERSFFPYLPLGQKLAYLRHQHGLGIARASAHIGGIKPGELIAYESGARIPPSDMLNQIASAYGLSVELLANQRA